MSISTVPAAVAQFDRVAQATGATTATAQEAALFSTAIAEARSNAAATAPADIAPAERSSAIGDQLDLLLDRIGFLDGAYASTSAAGGAAEPRAGASTLQSGSAIVDQTMATFGEILNVSVAATLVVRGTSQLTTTANQLARG
ncbi:hypothetical protein ACFQU1_17725 [Chelatococcus sp. GCM10030263]|uniref:hypothetical protein n=1 Tax=Chelatococcus sp. GCM10030263 TaxID=3273387 RepID=UPI00361D4B66